MTLDIERIERKIAYIHEQINTINKINLWRTRYFFKTR
ncbi:MAG: hypothetical protein PWR28_818 [Synergistaceae bacterium]|nr:hypothetical protein [Synergistaceae bacterium]